MDLSAHDWALLVLCSTMIGLTKVGIPGFTILAVPLMAMVIPAKQSVGALLGILMMGDMLAVVYHHKNAKWGHILRLIPATLAGVIAGFFGLQAGRRIQTTHSPWCCRARQCLQSSW